MQKGESERKVVKPTLLEALDWMITEHQARSGGKPTLAQAILFVIQEYVADYAAQVAEEEEARRKLMEYIRSRNPFAAGKEGDRAFRIDLGHAIYQNGAWIKDPDHNPLPAILQPPTMTTPRTIEVVRID